MSPCDHIQSAIGLLQRAAANDDPPAVRALIKLAIGDAEKAYKATGETGSEPNRPSARTAKTSRANIAGRWTGNRS